MRDGAQRELGRLRETLVPLLPDMQMETVTDPWGWLLTVRIRGNVLPTVLTGDDAEIREALHRGAEEVLATVKSAGWYWSAAPCIELTGALNPGTFTLDRKLIEPPSIVHKCRVVMDLFWAPRARG